MTDLHRFINALRILANINRHELTDAGLKVDDTHWLRFTNDLPTWFRKASDADARKVWEIVESRQPPAREPRSFGGYPAPEVADLLDALAKAADRDDARNNTQTADIARRGRDAIRYLLGQEVPNDE